MTITEFSRKYNLDKNQSFDCDLADLCDGCFNSGERLGQSTQAKLELQARDRFLKDLRSRCDEVTGSIVRKLGEI